MTTYCRLCAEFKESTEIVTSIHDSERLIEQKLVACCQWNVELDDSNVPKDVCEHCLDKLDKCWLFSQSVQSAQRKLRQIFDGMRDESEKTPPTDLNLRLSPSRENTIDCNEYSDNLSENDVCSGKLIPAKCELNAIDDNNDELGEVDDHIFVGPIALPEPTINSERPLDRSKIDKSDNTKSGQRHICDVCQKSCTTASNLKVCSYTLTF